MTERDVYAINLAVGDCIAYMSFELLAGPRSIIEGKPIPLQGTITALCHGDGCVVVKLEMGRLLLWQHKRNCKVLDYEDVIPQSHRGTAATFNGITIE